jgi:hypothetical protein
MVGVENVELDELLNSKALEEVELPYGPKDDGEDESGPPVPVGDGRTPVS